MTEPMRGEYLRGLSDAAREAVLEGVPDGTRRPYARHWRAFQAWCAEADRSALPAEPATLTEYVTHLTGRELSVSTIRQAVAAIRAAHFEAELEPPASAATTLVLRGYSRRRALAGQRPRKAPPVVVDPLRAMVDTCDDSVRGRRDRALLLLGVAMMARRSELAGLHLEDAELVPEGLSVLVRASKTDQAGVGRRVAIVPGDHVATCPVRSVRSWLDILADHGIQTGRLLRSIDRHGNIGAGLSGDAVNRIVRARAVSAGVERADDYTSHGLRAGGATIAAYAGKTHSGIAGQGGWSQTSTVVLGYIRAADQWRENPMRGVGL